MAYIRGIDFAGTNSTSAFVGCQSEILPTRKAIDVSAARAKAAAQSMRGVSTVGEFRRRAWRRMQKAAERGKS